MTKRQVYYVVHRADVKRDWAVKKQGNPRPIATSTNKERMVSKAVRIAKRHDLSQVKIQGRDALFQKEYTYGNDPEKYPG